MEIQMNYLADAFLALMIFIGAAGAAALVVIHEVTRGSLAASMSRFAVVLVLLFVLSGVAASGLHRLTTIQADLARTCDPPACTRVDLTDSAESAEGER